MNSQLDSNQIKVGFTVQARLVVVTLTLTQCQSLIFNRGKYGFFINSGSLATSQQSAEIVETKC